MKSFIILTLDNYKNFVTLQVMKMNISVFGFVVVCIIMLFLGFTCGMGLMQSFNRADAIQHKAAHYEMDSTTGKTTWHWNQ